MLISADTPSDSLLSLSLLGLFHYTTAETLLKKSFFGNFHCKDC